MSSDLKLRVPAHLAGAKLDEALDALIDGLSRSRLQKLVRRGHVRIDGRPVRRSNVKVSGRQTIELRLDEPLGTQRPAPELTILHEDGDLIVVDKPAGLLCHPTERSSGDTLSSRLVERFGPLPILKGAERPGIVHRLDRETSGVIVIARSDAAMTALEQQFRRREPKKTYRALVHGHPDPPTGNVDLALAPHPTIRDRQQPSAHGKPASTDYEVVESLVGGALVACRPSTGRRHQLRAHLEALGCPIVGDRMYGARGVELPAGVPKPGRHALHAQRLELTHPTSGEPLEFQAPWPADLSATLTAWQRVRS